MTELFVLGSSPAEEDTAQLGRTPDFDRLNRLEVDCYQAALIACYGPPPEGARFVRHGSNHDFGHYVELAIRFDPESEVASAYAYQVDEGLGRWFHAGFTAPVDYPTSTSPVIHHTDLNAAIRSVISIMRSPFPEGEQAITNLRAHYPDLVAA